VKKRLLTVSHNRGGGGVQSKLLGGREKRESNAQLRRQKGQRDLTCMRHSSKRKEMPLERETGWKRRRFSPFA